ncbi:MULTISPECIES: phosphotransferase enzyme family protein [Asaia]|uniref:phosphotransferase enzyme family protein n=1 Tax=Asaia TaxID=91914 RepID=UPI0025535A33|nr:phosphotransferase [Asaia sp. HumB]MDL2172317.1 phosphotransferase [Asaia sp. HumB]
MTEPGASEQIGQFGLWGKEAQRDWPLITKDEAKHVLAAFGLESKAPISWHSARPFSAVARVSNPGGQVWFLKRHHHQLRDRGALAEEHRLISHLSENGLPVACPRECTSESAGSGSTILVSGAWCYECFPALAGLDLYRDTMSWEPYRSPDEAFEAGSALARFHRAGRSFKAPSRSTRPLVSALTPFLGEADPEIAFRGWVKAQPALSEALDRQGGLSPLIAALTPAITQARPFLKTPALHWGHGDWHGSNLIWDCKEAGQSLPDRTIVRAPFDFGMADLTTRAFDIAVALERSMVDWMNPHAVSPTSKRDFVHTDQSVDYATRPDHTAAFLAGYDQEEALGPHDREEIAAMLPLAHVAFACSEVWYYDTLLRAPDTTEVTWETYLIGHLDWFDSPPGRNLCQLVATPPARA